MDTSMTAVALRVGAGVGHVRHQAAGQSKQLMDQTLPSVSDKSAALDLINSAIATLSGTTGHDLNVMA